MPLSGVAVAEIAVGGVLLYSGIKGYSLADTFTSLVKGTAPSDTEQIASTTAATTSGTSSTSAPAVAGDYSAAQLEQLWESQGGDASTAFEAAQVAMAESSGSASVTSGNPDGGTNVGLWQLDTLGVGSGYSVAELQDPETNAKITVLATHNGTDWSEWADAVVQNGQYTGPAS